MKSTTRSAIGALACSITMCVSAQTQPAGKTRAEVGAELVEAQRDGVVPAPKYDYPPSQDTIERNKQLYAINHQGERAHALFAAPAHSPRESAQ